MDGVPLTIASIFIHYQVDYTMVSFYKGCTLDHIKALFNSTGINWNNGSENGNMGNLHKLVYMFDKTLGPTVDPCGLQGPPGSSLCQPIAQINIL